MPSPIVEINAPSRLHCGMLSFGQPAMRQFGGVGAMIDQPGLRLRISPAERFAADGLFSERVRATAEQLLGIHSVLVGALLSLIALHVAGALVHTFWYKDTVLRRMWFNG